MPDSTIPDPLDVSPRPIPMPQTGPLTADPEAEAAAESLATPPNMGATIAQHQIAAGQVNNGDARDWAENTLAGVQAALAGFGAAGKVNPGSGALAGVGAASRQALERRDQLNREKKAEAQAQQRTDLEKQRVGLEAQRLSDAEKQTLVENARQQANDVRLQAEHDQRMQQFTDEHNIHNFELMRNEIDFRENQLDREETLKAAGATPMKVAGMETPAFDDLGQLEQFALKNGLAQQAHVNGYRERPIYGADDKYHIYQIPDAGPEWHTIKGPDNKPMRIFTDPTGLLNAQEKVANTKYAMAHAALDYAQGQKALRELKDEDTAKQARAALDKVGGDYDKLTPGQKLALRPEVEKQAQINFQMLRGAEDEMRKDPDSFNIETDDKGNPKQGDPTYKRLREKYHIDEINEQVGDSYDALRHLGYGHTAPGGGEVKETGPKAPAQGTPITPAAIAEFSRLSGGDPDKAKQMAIAAGWGPPQAPPADTRTMTQKVTDAVVQKLTGHPGPTAPQQ